MHELIALLSLVLSLFGLHLGGTRYTHEVDQGATQMYSEAWTDGDRASFECVRSSSGRCHYRVMPSHCAADPCRQATLRQFAVAEGATRVVPGLPEFRLDVAPFAPR